ncbi:hypothetical protein [Arthrobacter sp. AZCC_0090]|uniref:hypothetical protein n=1 Tax=Arthrobacter sp. AZCC_0090 TaxID=2735881 RepID=UPI001607AFBE|nr:hypothetical protein [Arthrobacter sp. AZCC_0090]MBB6407107.1 enoyl-CoA hydratase/carnithine racemase [Arthrobacter sp. AZCC_0090]
MTSNIHADARGRLGVITLDRPHGPKTLNHSMITATADSFAVGLSESHVPSTALPEPAAALESEQSEVAFAADTVPELLADMGAANADGITDSIAQKSPIAAGVTLESRRRARDLAAPEHDLIQEYLTFPAST